MDVEDNHEEAAVGGKLALDLWQRVSVVFHLSPLEYDLLGLKAGINRKEIQSHSTGHKTALVHLFKREVIHAQKYHPHHL